MDGTQDNDPIKTSEELFLTSFEGDYEDDVPWDAVRALRQRNTDEVFQLASAYSRSETPKHRARALDVLAQLGAGRPLAERPHFSESVSIVIDHLHDEDPQVVHSAAWALAHLNDERPVMALIEMRNYSDPDVRWAVAVGMANSERLEAIRTLIELMEDHNDEVRNWATFGLGVAGVEVGSMRFGTLDSSEIREALRKRLTDPFRDVRAEAMWGLARRKDPGALELLLECLDGEPPMAGDEMAAAEILGLECDAPIEDLRQGLRNLLGRK